MLRGLQSFFYIFLLYSLHVCYTHIWFYSLNANDWTASPHKCRKFQPCLFTYLESDTYTLQAQLSWQRLVIDIQNELLHLGLLNQYVQEWLSKLKEKYDKKSSFSQRESHLRLCRMFASRHWRWRGKGRGQVWLSHSVTL